MAIRAKLAMLGLGELALAIVLWRRGPVDDPLRWSDPVGWLRTTTAENALVEVGRVVVLALVAWMVVATLLALAARIVDLVVGTTTCVAAVSHVVPRFIIAMVVATLATSVPALAQTHTPVPPVGPVRDGRAATAPLPPTTAPLAIPTAPPTPIPTPTPSRTAATATTHVVMAGESLWSIARDRVGDGDALLPYWRALCDANRATLRSGDVNVIAPGETLVLPA
jgi:hypothetical protein